MADDTNEVSEMWRDFRAARAEKRAGNRASSADLLTQAGIEFVSKNGGAHLIVGRFDFWPGTGLWMERGNTRRRYGVRSLIATVKGNDDGR
jgi:hypothetical protein